MTAIDTAIAKSNAMPESDTSFRVYRRDDQSFGVEVVIDEMQPTSVSGFATREAAEAWIEGYKQRKKEIAEAPRGRRSRPARTTS
jgi:hypothetical protein